MLKRKGPHPGRTNELYVLGMNTLQALMFVLRLSKEWEQMKEQYTLGPNVTVADIATEHCIKLLTRCTKMYDAK